MGLTSIGPKNDISIGEVPFQLNANGYQQYVVTPFAPRVAPGNASEQTLDAWQAETFTDWTHGMGFVKQMDAQGYDHTTGPVCTHIPGIVSMQAKLATPPQDISVQVNVFAVHNNVLYAGLNTASGGSTLWYLNNSTTGWIAVTGTNCPTQAIHGLISAADGDGNQKLFIATADSTTQSIRIYDGAFTVLNNSSGYAKYFCLAGGYLWQADNANTIRYTSDPYNTSTGGAWSAPVKVGNAMHPVRRMCAYAGRLYIMKDDGLYYVDPTSDKDNAYPAAIFENDVASNNGRVMASHGGYLIFNIRNKLWKITPAHALADITPPPFGSEYPLIVYYGFRGGVSAGRLLWVMAQNTKETGMALMAYDGIGWHCEASAQTLYNEVQQSMIYEQTPSTYGRIWMSVSGGTRYLPTHLWNQDAPYPAFSETDTGKLYTSAITFDMNSIHKHWKSVQVETPVAGRKSATAGTILFNTANAVPVSATSVVDGQYALSTPTSWDFYKGVAIQATNFGLNIPSNAIVLGVQVELTADMIQNASGAMPAQVDAQINLMQNSLTIGTNQNAGLTFAPTYGFWGYGATVNWQSFSYGSSTNTWGVALTPAIVNDPTFGVFFYWSNGPATPTGSNPNTTAGLVDKLKMTVWYAMDTSTNREWSNDNGGTVGVGYYMDESSVYHALGSVANPSTRYTDLAFPTASGTLQSATSTTFTDSTLNQAAGYWNEAWIYITAGTGAGQERQISGFASGVGTVGTAWTETPDATSKYEIAWSSKAIRLRFDFSTDDTAKTPVLLSYTLRYIPRPERKLGWHLSLRVPNNLEWTTGAIAQRRSAMQIRDLLLAYRGFRTPVRFYDVDRTLYHVLVTDVSLTQTAVDEMIQGGNMSSREFTARVTLVEV